VRGTIHQAQPYSDFPGPLAALPWQFPSIVCSRVAAVQCKPVSSCQLVWNEGAPTAAVTGIRRVELPAGLSDRPRIICRRRSVDDRTVSSSDTVHLTPAVTSFRNDVTGQDCT
jgi:hypothetical protein